MPKIIETVKEKQLRLSILGSITVDCRDGQIDPMSNAFIQMSGVFAELELRMIRARVRSGMQNAKAKGARIGRPQTTSDDIPPVFYRHYPSFKNKSLNLSEFSRVCGMSRTTIYKYISLLER
jgi:DNA invertase Pin-like site-specific DNA recombinase